MGQGETVRIGCGPREVEEALLGEISAEIDAHRADPTLLARPLPSTKGEGDWGQVQARLRP